MDDLLGSLMQGGQQPLKPDEEDAGTDPLQQALHGMMGGGTSQEPDTEAGTGALPGGMDLGSLLQGILGGGGGLPAGTGPDVQGQGTAGGIGGLGGGMDLGSLLQGMLGGGSSLPGGTVPGLEDQGTAGGMGGLGGGMDLGSLLQGMLGGGGGLPVDAGQGLQDQGTAGGLGGGMDLGSLLQGMLGGGGGSGSASGSAGGMGGLLGALLGGGGAAAQSSSLLTPIVNSLAEKLGLPPELAQVVVTFVLRKLTSHRLRSASPGLFGAADDTGLDDVVQRMNSGQMVRKADIRTTGLAKELSAQTGLDRATAEASLQEVMNALSGQLGAGM